ncbi:Hypothetical predicted protein [Podarcis lilfordi]|uniref:Uncharacterized protein n=1 Tax=Podarcis lilfordi TaxID=74358 RepID=A0AA35L0W4_9SAUR|nr:Hypothetical predicted protein [Podarcis lilfordi]
MERQGGREGEKRGRAKERERERRGREKGREKESPGEGAQRSTSFLTRFRRSPDRFHQQLAEPPLAKRFQRTSYCWT